MTEAEKRLEAAAKGANAKLGVARSLMLEMGVWENPAGYLTDAALWIRDAQTELQAAIHPEPREPKFRSFSKRAST